MISRELISWEVDLVGVDLMGVDFVGVDLVGMNRFFKSCIFTCLGWCSIVGDAEQLKQSSGKITIVPSINVHQEVCA